MNFCPDCMAFNSTALEYDRTAADLPDCEHGTAIKGWCIAELEKLQFDSEITVFGLKYIQKRIKELSRPKSE